MNISTAFVGDFMVSTYHFPDVFLKQKMGKSCWPKPKVAFEHFGSLKTVQPHDQHTVVDGVVFVLMFCSGFQQHIS